MRPQDRRIIAHLVADCEFYAESQEHGPHSGQGFPAAAAQEWMHATLELQKQVRDGFAALTGIDINVDPFFL